MSAIILEQMEWYCIVMLIGALLRLTRKQAMQVSNPYWRQGSLQAN